MTAVRLVQGIAYVAVWGIWIAGAGCGDDASSALEDAGRASDARAVDVGGEVDAPIRETVTLTGTVYGAAVEGAEPTPLGGAAVSILELGGEVFDTTTTRDDGTYTLTAPRRTIMLHRVAPLSSHLGGLRAERVGGTDYEAYEVRLAPRDGVVAAVASAGSAYDASRGFLVVGFNPVSHEAGGEGARLTEASHDPAYGLYPGGVWLGNVLPPVCDAGEDPTADGCVPEGRLDQVFFPNIVGDELSIQLIDPPSGSCAVRYDVATYPVFADTSVKINVDCE